VLIKSEVKQMYICSVYAYHWMLKHMVRGKYISKCGFTRGMFKIPENCTRDK